MREQERIIKLNLKIDREEIVAEGNFGAVGAVASAFVTGFLLRKQFKS